MRNPTDEEIAGRLVAIISDGFNRSLGALDRAGAVNAKHMWKYYKGIGSKYYDLVTEQISLTAQYGVPAVRELFQRASPEPDAE